MIVQDEGNNGRQAGKKHVPDEFFPYRLLLPLNSHGTSPDRHFAGQRTQQNRESSNGPLRAGGKPVPTLGSRPRAGFFGIMLFV
jgi:hypothetical protein